ncbi:hypothetical protein, partial [Corynebacterium simulans]|uniref:hypothetical protein n=1 Tax=Corynebacterium simulans TaxID=146827 RepID=UPI0020048893
IFRQDAVLYKTDHTILRILVKFSWHIPDFPIYSNGTKPGTLQIATLRLLAVAEVRAVKGLATSGVVM